MMNNGIRDPIIENKYNLRPKDIQHARLINPEKLHQKPFWRNDVVHAWCLSGGAGKGLWGGYENEYWIGFYDEDAPCYAGKIRLHCTSYEGICNYVFKKFYNPKDIVRLADLELQEQLLDKINWLIDEKIIKI